MPVKLAVFSYARMKNEMEGVWNEFQPQLNIQVIEGVLGEALRQAKGLEKKGDVDVYISSGANAELLRQNVSTPVVTIKVTAFDLIRSIKKAQQLNGRIAVINFEKNNPEFQEIQDLLEISIAQDVYASEKELIRKLHRLKQSGVNIIIGHSLACDLAEKQGMQSVLVYSRESVRQAIEHAYEIALSRRREMARTGRLQAILDYTYSGIIATDAHGEITVFNKVAEKIVGVPAKKAIGQAIDKIIPTTRIHNVIETLQAELNQLQRIGSSHIFTNRVPIFAHNELVGIVATFQDVTTIQQAEGKIRQDLHGKGLVAKFCFDDILGNSPALRATLDLARKFAATESTIMITGETGTGKELLAQSIHNYSPRSNKPFVAVNCSALPDTLLESELFGYEEGAFTGARRGGKMGLFELAHTGTIFLDEIGEIPPALQSRLLRVLQEREIMRVGSNRIIPIDVRVITATNNDLWQAVKEKKMRADLYYRLNVLYINLPPLRGRRGDVSLLARYYVKKFDPDLLAEYDSHLPEIAPILESCSWPGNIRELQNVMERLAVLMRGAALSRTQITKYLNEVLHSPPSPADQLERKGDHPAGAGPLAQTLSLDAIERVLREVNGNKSAAARHLGVSRMTLWRKLRGR